MNPEREEKLLEIAGELARRLQSADVPPLKALGRAGRQRESTGRRSGLERRANHRRTVMERRDGGDRRAA